MPSRSEYDQTLSKLAEMLKRKPLTARQIAKSQQCSKPVAYQRIRSLQDRGVPIYELPVRESPRGPLSTAYGIRD